MGYYFGNTIYFSLFLLLVGLVICLFYYYKWKKSKRKLFATSKYHLQLYPKTNKFSVFFIGLYILGFSCLVFAMVDLLGGSKEVKSQQKMNNVIFLLDVSNSMNAQDIEPSRLTQAKNIIINTLPKLNGDRVGIVVFAGEAFSIMPLTTDYNAVENYLAGLETSIMPAQGTDFLKAIEVVVDKFKKIPKGARKVIMISDGEDNEGNEERAINLAKKQAVNITTIGVGGEVGAPIPDYYYGQLMGYKTDVMGETVMSSLQTKALKNIANSTKGKYINGNELDGSVNELIRNLGDNTSNSSYFITSSTAEHYFQYFLGGSILCFLVIYLFNPKRDLNI